MNDLALTSRQNSDNALMEVESKRAMQEVQAAMIIAKKFPRDQNSAHTRIMKACERYSLADKAEYAYPRGDKTVTGPSIRLAETIAQQWGNLQFGIKELSQIDGASEIEAFCWDIETNTKETKTFKVPHSRYSKKKGVSSLKDPRDIYEHVANQGARRLRACILGIIPADIVEDAQVQCRKTLKKGISEKPMIDQIRAILSAFDKIGVAQEMIEARLGHSTETINDEELVELKKIGTSIRDNMTNREAWFEFKKEPPTPTETEEKAIYKAEPEGEKINDPEESKLPPTIQEEIGTLRTPGLIAWEKENHGDIMHMPPDDRKFFLEKWERTIKADYFAEGQPGHESAPASEDEALPPADGEFTGPGPGTTKNFDFLKTMKGLKSQIEELDGNHEAYYGFLGLMGFEKSNQITDRKDQLEIHATLKAHIAESKARNEAAQ